MSENNRPQGWGKDHKLPDNWGKQSSGLESKTLSGGVSMSSSEPDKKSDIKAEDKVSFSDKARSGAGKLAGIAKKVGGAAKNAAGNAVEYAKSDEAKEKLNAVKSKAKSIADGADSAFTDLKEKTGDAINERRSSKVESALSDNNTSDNLIDDTFAPHTYKDRSSDIAQIEDSYNDSITNVSHLKSALDSESDESSDTLDNAGLSADRQDIPDIATEDDEYVVAGNRKGIIIALVLIIVIAGGITGGIFLMKNKGTSKSTSSDVSESNISTQAAIDLDNTEATKANEITSEIITTSIITTEIASTTTEQEKTTMSVVTDKYQIYKDKILASVNNEEYAGNDSHIENAPADMVFYDIDGTLSQISLSNTVLYTGPGSSYDEVYITGTTEKLNIVGENSDWYYLMFYTGMGKFSHMTYGYASKKTSISNDSKPTASISIEPQITIHEGAHIKVVVNGDYNYYTYDFYYDGGGSYNCSWKSGTSYNSSILLDGPDIIGRGIFYVTPYYNNGTVGETVSITYEGPWKIWSQNFNSVTPVTKYGQINAPGGSPINGYTTEYIVNNGAYSCIRTDLMNNWHVTAVNSFSKNGTTWYELYDTDDGDYYGWVDEDHIKFY